MESHWYLGMAFLVFYTDSSERGVYVSVVRETEKEAKKAMKAEYKAFRSEFKREEKKDWKVTKNKQNIQIQVDVRRLMSFQYINLSWLANEPGARATVIAKFR